MKNSTVKKWFIFIIFFVSARSVFAQTDPNWPLRLRPGNPKSVTAVNASSFELSGYCEAGAGDVSISFGTIVSTAPCHPVLGVYRFQGDVSSEVTTNPIYQCVTQSVYTEQCSKPGTNELAPAGMVFIPDPLKKITPLNELSYKARGHCAPSGAAVSIDIGGEPSVLAGVCLNNNTFLIGGDVSAVSDGVGVSVLGVIGGVGTASATVDKGVGVSIEVAADISLASSTSYGFSGICSENGEDVLLSIGGVPVLPSPICTGEIWSVTGLDVSALDDGTVAILADHSDSLGNPATTASISVLKDTSPPVVTVGSAPGVYLINQDSYDFSGTCSEEGLEVTVSVGGLSPVVEPICASGEWSVLGLDVSSLGEGVVVVAVEQADVAGNLFSTSFNTFKELTPLMFLANSSQTTGGTNLNLTADELEWSGLLVSSYYFEIDAVNSNVIRVKQPGDYRLSFSLGLTAAVSRANLLIQVKVNGSLVQGAASASSYIRNGSGHNESSNHIDVILNDLSASDTIEVQVEREGVAGAVTGTASLFLEPIAGDKVFRATASQVVGGANLNVSGGDSLVWTHQKVSSDYSHNNLVSPEQIEILNSGNYFVSTNVPLFSTVGRVTVASSVLLDSVPVPGAVARQSYIRAASGHNTASAHWQGILEGVTASQILEVQTSLDSRTGMATVLGSQAASVSIEKIEETNYISLTGTDVVAGTNWNQASSVNWDSQSFIDAGVFSHTVGAGGHEITVLEPGEYFVSYSDSLTSTVVRANVRVSVLVNGSPTDLICKSHYIRSNNGHNSSSCSISGLLEGLSIGDTLTFETSQEAVAGVVTANEEARLFILKK